MMNRAQQPTQNKPWKEYPAGTKVYAATGGSWEKTASGWKWFTGGTFPTPGMDWLMIAEPFCHSTP